MLDFMMIATRSPKRGVTEIYPKFIIGSSSDLMIRGSDFYAVWDEENKLWSTQEERALYLIDRGLDEYAKKHSGDSEDHVRVLHMWDAESGMIDRWHKYVQKQQRDSYHPLDEKLIFSNTDTSKNDYASKRLKYPLEACETPAYDELVSTLYSAAERHKIEWAIGAIISGDSKKIQKFMVMYGAAGTGKSTVLNIIQDLFKGYYCVFDSKALGSANSTFALEPFKTNPLVAIQHDGDLSHIEDNTRLNSLVSHEEMTVNEKFRSAYTSRFNCFLFMGTNRPVRITDAKSGIIRRLIDVSPTGNKIPASKYKQLVAKAKFELGGIAMKCLDVYKEDPGAYDSYVPTAMMGASNDFFNFVLDSYDIFKRDDGTALKAAWEMYKTYCEDAKVNYPLSLRLFKEELKAYFRSFEERARLDDESRPHNYYSGFMFEKFEYHADGAQNKERIKEAPKINFDIFPSEFDKLCSSYPAQLATEDGIPSYKWSNVTTKLRDIDTHKLHYVKVPKEHIVIDFDLKDENGNKSYDLNIAAASKWPETYAELSKSGAGIHLHYIYSGDATKLSHIYDDNIEVKVFTGNSSLRRMLTKCNNLPIATINTGLPLKEDKKMVDFEGLKNEKAIRTLIRRNLLKEYCAGTKPSIDFIFDTLEDCYKKGVKYDVSDLEAAIMGFACNSTHHSDYCIKKVTQMKFKSEELTANFEGYENDTIVFVDVEVFSNLLVVVWKAKGEEKHPVKMINPTPRDISELIKFKLIGFNNRNYDNHILYGRLLGYTNEQLFDLSQRIIDKKDRNAKFGNAYNISYTDIYDFSAKKQSLKKFEIDLGIHHQELGLKWNEPVPEDKWELVADYCVNDVLATEAVFNARKGDFVAREILAALTGGTVNDTTNTLTTRLIFGTNKNPQGQFSYRNLAEPVFDIPNQMREFLEREFPEMMSEPHGEANSILPYFPGYLYDNGISTYKEHEVGEGGFVWAKPGMYKNVVTFDVASMHPHSVTSEFLFGPFTENFNQLMEARIAIKHKDFDKAGAMFGGKLKPYLADPSNAKALSNALKIAINSVYGLTAAGFINPFRDIRNKDNIVAKRGALFMIDLLEYVHSKGGEVCHIKTDSIKLVNPSEELMSEVMAFGKRYGYTFEVEHKFEKICLVNNAVYIAKLAADDPEEPGHWTATGTQFAIPYIFKTLFSKEPIEFSDLCETKAVTTNIYLDMNEKLGDDEHSYHFVGKVGSFCPIKPGFGGGELVREGNNGKYAAVTGSKGYRWLEAEMVKNQGMEELIDKNYYISLANQAIEDISKFGDFEWFSE